jgi:hypothetical protein
MVLAELICKRERERERERELLLTISDLWNARNARKFDLLYVNKIRNRCSRISFLYYYPGIEWNGISPPAVTLRWRSWGDAICRRHQHAVAPCRFCPSPPPSLPLRFLRLLAERGWEGPGRANMGRPRLTRGPRLVLGVGFVSFLVSALHHFFLRLFLH